MTARIPAATLLLVLGAAAAVAQPLPLEPHRQSVGAGAQWAMPFDGHGAPGALVSWRRWSSDAFGFGADVRWWSRHLTEVTPRRLSSSAAAVSAFARTTAGRLSLIGGAGPAWFLERTTIDPGQRGSGSTRRSIGLQSTLELDVRANSRVSMFAALHFELRDVRRLESSSGYPALGVRLAF